MIRNIVTLTLNDLAIAFTNKTLLLVIFIPLFVFLSLQLVDEEGADFKMIRIGLLGDADYSAGMLDSIKAADQVFAITWLVDTEAGASLLQDKKIDGMLTRSVDNPTDMDLVVLTKASNQTLAVVESITALQNAFEGKTNNWITRVQALHDSGIQQQTLPTWVLMLVLLVGFIILPVQVAEEKEKNLLLGLLQTPVREIEWLVAKLLLGIILISVAAGFLHLLSGYYPGAGSALVCAVLLVAGAFCFSAFGIFLGFLCGSQASARTLGVLFYLPNLLPAALSDFSSSLSSVAPLLPSYHFYEPFRSVLLEGGELSAYTQDLVYLLAAGLVLLFLSWWVMKKRWRM